MNGSYQDALSDPSFDALTIELEGAPEGSLQEAARTALQTALSGVPGVATDGWQVRAVHAGSPNAFDFLPPDGGAPSAQQAFQLKYKLEEQTGVAFADALFETNLDNLPEAASPGDNLESLESDALPLSSLGASTLSQLTASERDPLWSLRLIEADQAWLKTDGAGVVIGHPDSGYIRHIELDDDRILHEFERDVYEGDVDAQNPTERGGNHGLSTASVIMSGRNQLSPEAFVVGVAPGARIVPMRITKKGPPVFLSRSGPRRVRDAIYHAIDSGCQVISMSLGGLGDRSLERAIQEAVRRNILVLAAAGNVVRIVVWPARYRETIAVAACTADRKRWFHSSRGKLVDVTAPGHNVWRAYITEGGDQSAFPSSGTSYAVATAAGVAALWLAFHGRDNLLQRYPSVPLQEVFRKVLRESCDPPPQDHAGLFGSGIINARRALEAPLPAVAEVEQDVFAAPLAPGFQMDASQSADRLTEVFDTVDAGAVRGRLCEMFGSGDAQLDAGLAGVEDELIFHILTNPSLRQNFLVDDDTLLSDAAPAAISATLRDQLLAVPELSENLRMRL